jgi:hypothetical protein
MDGRYLAPGIDEEGRGQNTADAVTARGLVSSVEKRGKDQYELLILNRKGK